MMRQGQETTRPKMTNGSSDLFSIPDDEFTELVWENGQILMQNQSNKGRKSSCVSSGFSPRYGTVQEKESREKVGSGHPPSRHSANNGVNAQDDDVVSWISYPIEEILPSETLQNDYCAEFLNEFSAFDVNPLSTHRSNVAGTGRTAGLGQEVRSSNNVEHGHVAKPPNWSSLGSSRIRASHLQQCPASALNSKLTVVDIRSSDDNVAQEPQCQDVMDRKFQNQELASCKQMQQQGGMGTLMNFSHFIRPAALAKVGLHNATGLQNIEKASTPSRNPVTLTLVERTRGSKEANKVQGQSGSGPHRLEFGSTMKILQGRNSVEFSNKISAGDTLRNNTEKHTKLLDDLPSSSFAASVALCRHDIRKDPEAVIPSSSVCSENITGAASNEPNHGKKRKEYDAEDSDYLSHSEDLQDESINIRKPPSGRDARTKRSRTAEVHNLSERRRRNRINEKMRALQELIPNCNKVDKASMLEEAIEYLKTLQMQVQQFCHTKQIMSMGSRLYLPPTMMFPPAMQHMRGPMATHFPPIGVGMGSGMGLAPGCPMIPISPMHASQFLCTSSSGIPGLNGVPGPVNPSIFGIQGQGFPVLMPRPQQFGTLAGFSLNTNAEPEVHTDNAVGVASDQQKQQNLNVEPSTSTDETHMQRQNTTCLCK
ncbi:transcription factor PIF3-like isoform X1 [Zingiber officinale]|uniref:transcription factor PIF3-like isoform X1 n=1 Tax=Zingiber officinale TaxID=94328 RepID=UPI001C4B3560|nr:transcription factor PIF3-like isoform X1 [Zingiber officinale]XP_042443698.1 transcription factor PIF3-like isoform X1 [Zingiber officinale]